MISKDRKSDKMRNIKTNYQLNTVKYTLFQTKHKKPLLILFLFKLQTNLLNSTIKFLDNNLNNHWDNPTLSKFLSHLYNKFLNYLKNNPLTIVRLQSVKITNQDNNIHSKYNKSRPLKIRLQNCLKLTLYHRNKWDLHFSPKATKSSALNLCKYRNIEKKRWRKMQKSFHQIARYFLTMQSRQILGKMALTTILKKKLILFTKRKNKSIPNPNLPKF